MAPESVHLGRLYAIAYHMPMPTNLSVVSLDAAAAGGDWPSFVGPRHGDALEVLAEGGTFDLIFADAPGGKWEGLDRSVAALRPHGLLVVDDMTPQPTGPAPAAPRRTRSGRRC
jgi:predicted O-methyltransferase YrrM